MKKRNRKDKRGIWQSNKYQNQRSKKYRRIKPKQNRCSKCGTGKVIHHHHLCDKCWDHKTKLEGKMKWKDKNSSKF